MQYKWNHRQNVYSIVPSIKQMFTKRCFIIATITLYLSFCKILPTDFSASSLASCQSILHIEVKTKFSKANRTLSYLTSFHGVPLLKALIGPLAACATILLEFCNGAMWSMGVIAMNKTESLSDLGNDVPFLVGGQEGRRLISIESKLWAGHCTSIILVNPHHKIPR